jgi:tRNA uridine 5-carboxymethylaminomethyl modification enzyme
MLTSRAEHRVILRHDNADLRLTPIAHELGLIGDEPWTAFSHRREALAAARRHADRTKIPADAVPSTPLPGGATLADALRRPTVGVADVLARFPSETDPEIAARAEIEIKMDGYVRRQKLAIDRALRDEAVELPSGLDYAAVRALSHEAREKLDRTRPRTLGAAARIPGMTPADIALLSVHVHRLGMARPAQPPAERVAAPA